MTSNEGWIRFNSLMNDLREEIARRGKELMPITYASYYFEEKDRFHLFKPFGEFTQQCRGIKYDDGGISIILWNYNEGINEKELQDPIFSIEDFLFILTLLEK